MFMGGAGFRDTPAGSSQSSSLRIQAKAELSAFSPVQKQKKPRCSRGLLCLWGELDSGTRPPVPRKARHFKSRRKPNCRLSLPCINKKSLAVREACCVYGGSWIRTNVPRREEIYSLPHLAALPSPQGKLKRCWRQELNPRPPDYKSEALPLSYTSKSK
jgi:hypothetical protein